MDIAGIVRQYLAGEIDIATFASGFSMTGVAVSKSGDAALMRLYRQVDDLFRQGYDEGLPIEAFRSRLQTLVSA